MTSGEIAAAAAAAAEAGAAMLHMHVRTPEGRHSLDPQAYLDATAAVCAAVGKRLLIQITTESVGMFGRDVQEAAVRAVRPQAASMALREFVSDEKDVPAFANLLGWMRSERIAAQIILYEPDEARRLADLRQRGALPDGGWSVLYVLGRYATAGLGSPAELAAFLAVETPPSDDWMLCCFGPDEARLGTAAALMGGDIRVGFENNLTRANGQPARDNTDLVTDAAAGLTALSVPLITADALAARWQCREG